MSMSLLSRILWPSPLDPITAAWVELRFAGFVRNSLLPNRVHSAPERFLNWKDYPSEVQAETCETLLEQICGCFGIDPNSCRIEYSQPQTRDRAIPFSATHEGFFIHLPTNCRLSFPLAVATLAKGAAGFVLSRHYGAIPLHPEFLALCELLASLSGFAAYLTHSSLLEMRITHDSPTFLVKVGDVDSTIHGYALAVSEAAIGGTGPTLPIN